MWMLYQYWRDIHSQLHHRLDFAIQLVVWVLYAGLPFIGLQLLLERFGPLGSWTAPRMGVLYGCVLLGYETARMLLRSLDNFHKLTLTGSLDGLLVRPRALLLTVASRHLFLRRLSGITVAGTILGISLAAGGCRPADAGAALVATTSMLAICAALLLFYAATCFWTVTKNLFSDVVIGSFVSLSFLPVEHLPPFLQPVLTWLLPVRTAIQAPLLLAGADASPERWWLTTATALASPLPLVLAAIVTFHLARRHYLSPGART